MKQSHYTTPRTMADAEFQYWGETIHGYQDEGFDAEDKIVVWACVGATLALVAMAFVGWLA